MDDNSKASASDCNAQQHHEHDVYVRGGPRHARAQALRQLDHPELRVADKVVVIGNAEGAFVDDCQRLLLV